MEDMGETGSTYSDYVKKKCAGNVARKTLLRNAYKMLPRNRKG